MFRSPASALSVSCTGGVRRSAPVGLVGSGTSLHSPIFDHIWTFFLGLGGVLVILKCFKSTLVIFKF